MKDAICALVMSETEASESDRIWLWLFRWNTRETLTGPLFDSLALAESLATSAAIAMEPLGPVPDPLPIPICVLSTN